MIAQITYFGQFPTKLFIKEHPKRALAISRPITYTRKLIEAVDNTGITGHIEDLKI